MSNRRVPARRRPYYSLSAATKQAQLSNNITAVPEDERIPLPTEEDKFPLPGREKLMEGRRRSLLDIIPFRIGVEELLLLGLIFILFLEGIDDDILILLLLYILFAGFE